MGSGMTEIQRTALPPLSVLATLAALSVAALALSACVSGGGSWYDRYCQRKGYQPGTGAFEKCRQETREWIEWTQQEADRMRPSGPR